MNKSLLIGWVPPEVPPGRIEGYHVYVDGVPKATIKYSERTRALIEGVDSSRPHRVSVRSISSSGYQSKDAACTIVVGKDFPLAPTCVKASHITASSALISWLPSNSNFQHVVAVNSVEVKVVKPGCFRHHVTGLSPNTLYRVSVRVKPGKLLYNDEKNPKKLEMLVSNVEFRTLPKGLPDPPVNVQVEQGPQDGTLLVTWLPVPTNPASSLISPVTGYAVFVAGKKVAEIDSPTGDHALIDGSQLLTLNKKCITVRSKSMDGLSADSLVCAVPNDLLRSVQKGKPKMLCKVESINETDDLECEDIENDKSQSQEYQSKSSHTVRRMNQNPPSIQVPSQRRQGWKEQSYSNRSCTAIEGNGTVEHRSRREHRNNSGQIVLDSDETLSDKEMYLSSRANIPSIAVQEGNLSYKITKDTACGEDCDTGFSDDEYDPRRRGSQRPTSPEGYTGSSSQQRPLRTEPDAHHSQNSRSHRGPQTQHHHSQQHPQRDRSLPRRQPHDSTSSRSQPPVPPNQAAAGRQRISPQSHNIQDQNRRSTSRNQSPAHVASRSGQPSPAERDSNHSYYNKRRSVGNISSAPSQTNRRMSDFHEPMSRYEDQGNYDSYSSHVSDVGDNRVRYFVALFDYDPQSMSPNPDAADEELPFQEGQMIKIYGDKDADGFYRGESNGRVGLVPGNMVSEVQVDVDPVYYNDNTSRPRSLGQIAMDERDADWQSRRIKKMVAIYDYDPQEISPNVDAEMELSFSVGDVIYVIGDVDEDGFYMGELNGVKGLVPSNFLREMPIEEDEKRHASSRPKGQGRSYLGRADCQWNGYQERIISTPKMQLSKWTTDENTQEVQKNHIIQQMLDTKELRHLQDTHRLPIYGTKGSLKENLHPEDHMYHLEVNEYPTRRLLQDRHHLISTGKRPTFLDLQGSPISCPRNYNLSSEEQRIKYAPDFMIPECSLPKQSRKGIFSSFKDIFKANKKI
ncbi:RIMS-binding protein 2-like isoform X2 [Stegodyphus dumicola]|uniref:RIMS-binding protein 2-like isoform X2 n=1 Tax=Stegodyphus dumicola TaxID=202533 RepID=UPI0015A9E338|nr:RIMS-binding protein 2-like isoform X2 [Stegodyphus dumicola]